MLEEYSRRSSSGERLGPENFSTDALAGGHYEAVPIYCVCINLGRDWPARGLRVLGLGFSSDFVGKEIRG